MSIDYVFFPFLFTKKKKYKCKLGVAWVWVMGR